MIDPIDHSDLFFQISQWNLERNGLQFDPDLEVRLLTEEANEFFTATTLLDRIDAFLDFMFVYHGTKAKIYGTKVETWIGLDHHQTVGEQILDYADKVRDLTHSIMVMELKPWFAGVAVVENGSVDEDTGEYIEDDQDELQEAMVHDFLTRAFLIVLECNKKKGTETHPDGKIKKGENFMRPEPAIAKLFKEMTQWDLDYVHKYMRGEED